MMIKKQLGFLAASILVATSSHAAIDTANAIFFAYDTDNDDTYFLDLGITAQSLADGATVSVTSSGLFTFLGGDNILWSIVGATTTGLVGTATATADGLGTTGTLLTSQRNGWLVDLAAAAATLGAATEGLILGTDPSSQNIAKTNGQGFNASLFDLSNLSSLFRTDPVAGPPPFLPGSAATILVGDVNSSSVDALTGTVTVSAVPVPAAAWLFGSALLGLGVVRRK